jgi:phosphoglycerate dehydrogenase-like enzyme
MMGNSLKVVSTFRFSLDAQKVLRQAAQSDVLCINNVDDLRASLHDAEILCAYWLPQDWRDLAPHLTWLQVSGAGVDGLRSTGILDEGCPVVVTTSVGIHAIAIGEYVFGSMLMFNRSWPEMVHLQDRHIWPVSTSWYKFRERELYGQTLGSIAQLGKAFGMHVVATRRSLSTVQLDADVDQLYPATELQTVLRQSDYVVLSVPLTKETERLIGEAELRAMKPHAYLINIARGQVVDEPVLIRALQEGWIAGAGLDVVGMEPLPATSPLFTLPNVILTPHISGVSARYEQRLTDLFAENLRRYRAGQPLLNRYEATRGY